LDDYARSSTAPASHPPSSLSRAKVTGSTPSERLRFRNIRRTSAFRLTLLLGTAATIGILALLALIYALSARELDQRSDRILRAEAGRLAAVPPAALQTQIEQATSRNDIGLNYFGLLSSDGRPLAGNLGSSSGYSIGHILEIPAEPGRHGPVRLLGIRIKSGEIVLIGRDITPLVDLRQWITEVILLSGLIVVPLTLIAALLLSLAPLRRVQRLQNMAVTIAAGDLDGRMPILGRGDELDLFASTVNYMVDEVGRIVAQVKSVTDAIAHDLRTPLTRVRSQLYRASQQPDIDPAVAARLDASIADLDAVIACFAALLRISELEAGNRRSHFRSVMLDQVAAAVMDLYEPLAEENGIRLLLEAEPGTAVFGDENLLFEALSNLVDNAIKYGGPKGQVTITVRRNESTATLEVSDNGPGIALDRHKAVLRRFDRGAASSDVPGSGLGLSIVSAIVQLHHFSLELRDASPGLIVTVTAATQ
jgi:signal transduction histidine kinase